MRALITGDAGFAGRHLRKSLEDDGHQVDGFDLTDALDVRDYEAVYLAVSCVEPDLIFHLAAVAWPRESLSDPRRCMDVNVTGTLNVLEAIRHTGSHARLLITGTSEEYGYEGREELTEDAVCAPTTPYGASKLAATALGMAYAHRYGLPVVVTRAFNHSGWGRQAVNAESSFARRIVAFERGEADHVAHGDLSAMRNFTNVADVVRAYRAAIGLASGIYNVCSDDTVTMAEVMSMLLDLAGLRDGSVLKETPGLGTREAPLPFPRPSYAKLRAESGWQPVVPLRETLRQLLDYWRSR